jgi:hypothetical protein
MVVPGIEPRLMWNSSECQGARILHLFDPHLCHPLSGGIPEGSWTPCESCHLWLLSLSILRRRQVMCVRQDKVAHRPFVGSAVDTSQYGAQWEFGLSSCWTGPFLNGQW